MKPKVCILRTNGTNCDRETKFAFEQVGAEADILSLPTLIKGYDPATGLRPSLKEYHIAVIPGGFADGDYIASARRLAQEMKKHLEDEIEEFVTDGKLVLGICNGFQALVKYGLLPRTQGTQQTVTLTYNDNATFQARWVNLKAAPNNCIWTQGIDRISLPVAHGEGRLYAPEATMDELVDEDLVVFQYVDLNGNPTMTHPENPNGAMHSAAALCDPSGKIFGLMPHPERFNTPGNHPYAQLHSVLDRLYVDKNDPVVCARRDIAGETPTTGRGLEIIANGVNYAREHLI